MVTRQSVIGGYKCDVQLTKEGNGYSYEVWRRDGISTRTMICSGWSAGTLMEAWVEAEDHATKLMRRTA